VSNKKTKPDYVTITIAREDARIWVTEWDANDEDCELSRLQDACWLALRNQH
jgi:hypothetical protein